MSAKIRLQRKGRKKQPEFQVVVTSSEAGASAGYIEKLGNYHPEADDELTIDEDRAIHWLETGAQPSDTVHNLFSEEGLLEELEEKESASA